jgi:hypothetical protein
MTGAEMLTNLGQRLEDPAGTIFTTAVKLENLNIAQKNLVNMIHNAYLTELETVANNKVAGAGSRWSTCTFATAFSTDLPIRNGIIKIYDETNDKWCTIVEFKDVKKLENSYLAGDTTSPRAFIFDETIYIQPTSCVLIDVWYLKAPTALANDSNECVLNTALHDIVLDLAESKCWRMDGKPEKAQIAQNSATSMIGVLNERYAMEMPEGVEAK